MVGTTLEIRTARLCMRPWTHADVDALHALWITPEVRRYLWDGTVITREQAVSVVDASLESFARDGFGMWAVLALSGDPGDAVIGFCGLRWFGEPPAVELLYGLDPRQWGQGLATEAARAMLRYGFDGRALERIFAGADSPNAASFRLMARLGMRFDRRLELDGLPADYYAIARADFHPGDEVYHLLRL